MPQGRHTAEFRVFDVYNNSAESSIRFVAEGEPKFRITRLYNYPNPFDCGHTFFYLEHNRPDAEMDIEMQIFALNGALLSVQRCTIFGGDTRPPHNYALWDGTLSNGAPCPAGIYIYKVSAKCRSGERAEKTGKLLYLCTK